MPRPPISGGTTVLSALRTPSRSVQVRRPVWLLPSTWATYSPLRVMLTVSILPPWGA